MENSPIRQGAELVCKRLAETMEEWAKECADKNPERFHAYSVAANWCRIALTGGYGWMLDLQKELEYLEEQQMKKS